MSQEKEVIYLEAEAEITEAIDKLRVIDGKSVQIVVPGRSNLLQSVVNLKLLKKAAKDHNKELILVTNDKTATNLAGKVGLAVAASVGASAMIPQAPQNEPEPDIIEPVARPQSSPNSSSNQPKSESIKPSSDEGPVMSKRAIGEDKKPSGKGKKPKVPNFDSFQKKMWLVGGLVGVVLFILILVYFVQPVTAIVTANAQKKAIEAAFTLSPNSASSNPADGIIAAKETSLNKDYTANFTATGKKDVGTKASGSASIKNCEDSDSRSLPAGSKLVASGKTFVSTAAATIPGGDFSNGGQTCDSTAASVSIAAEQPGDSYNLSNASFTVTGQSSRISGSGTTTGGTSKTVTIVTQADIDGAKNKMLEGAQDSAKNELFDKAKKDNVVFEKTFKAEEVSFSSSVPAGGEANNGSVSAKYKYSVLSATKKDLDSLLNEKIKGDLPSNFEIYDNGLSGIKYTKISANSNGQYDVEANTTAYIGEKIDKSALAKKLAGKNKKEAADIAKSFNPSIKNTIINGWPLVPNMPLLSGNIKIEIKVDTTE